MNETINEKRPVQIPMPRPAGEHLLLRWGRPEDAEAVAEFNIRVHSDEPGEPEMWIGDWTRVLMSGAHPTTTASDFTVVEDTRSGAIVSTQVLISQTWLYDGVPFGVGRPELVGTDETHRRQGLIRQQMEVAHALSAEKGHLVQAITGIPWYYRMFGYEMALNLGGGCEFFWTRPGNDKPQAEEPYHLRAATTADIPLLQELYQAHCARSLLALQRTPEIWRHLLQTAPRDTMGARHANLISDRTGRTIAYVEYRQLGTAFVVRELGVIPGYSWREVALFVSRELKRQADELNLTREKPITNISFSLGEEHPVYQALGRQLERAREPYAWYMRVADLPRFVRHIAPVLEARLARSVVAGHSGTLRLNFYRDNLQLTFQEGAVQQAGRYQPRTVEDADAAFPDLTFLQLLFGYRSLDQLQDAFADCYAEHEEAAVLLSALFPRQPSDLQPLD